jgi:selenocysteine-specific translation elongation factor
MVITDKLEKSTLEEKIHLKVSESDEQALQRVKDRFDDMKKGRSEQEALRDYIDKTFKAKPSYKWN